jgi:organic radical activating enzyme
MRGTNPVRAKETNPDRLQVHEIFLTLQGEGPFSGQRAVFVRMSGCNLRCWWCDTQWDDDRDPYMSPDEMFRQIKELARRKETLVVLTGGEPCRQNLLKLVELLWSAGYPIQVETAGVIWQDWLLATTIVVSPKTPLVHPKIREHAKYWKYPLLEGHTDSSDGLPYTNTQRTDGPKVFLSRPPPNSTVYITPVDTPEENTNGNNRALVARTAMQYGYTAQLQIHKYLEIP